MKFPIDEAVKFLPTTDVDNAYLAGILDGEGTFCISLQYDKRDGKKQFQIVIQIGMTDLPLLLWINARYGGKIYRHSNKKQKAHWKDSYVIQWKPKNILRLASQIFPHIKIKKAQLELLIRWMNEAYIPERGTAGMEKLTPEIRQLRETMREQMMSLNGSSIHKN